MILTDLLLLVLLLVVVQDPKQVAQQLPLLVDFSESPTTMCASQILLANACPGSMQ